MWNEVSLLISRWWSNVRLPLKINFKLKFLLIFLLIVLLYLGWEKWLLAILQPLPQRSTTFAQRDSLLGGSYYETSVPPVKTAKYSSADYRLWVPNDVQTLRGLIVKQHGCGNAAAATGLDHANDLQWQALASKHQFALLGTKLSVGDRACENWAFLNSGSGDAFLEALRDFSQKSHHSELDKVPWVFWGHSGGADWGAQMLRKYPNRTIALILMRCGGGTFPDTNEQTLLGIPVLFAVAEKETVNASECRDLTENVFFRYRKAGALWALAAEADTGHESGNTRLLAIPYLDAILTTRLAALHDHPGSIDEARGWLGNTTTHAIAPLNQYEGDPLAAAWLPNEETAHKWQEYTSAGVWNRVRYMLCRGERLLVRQIAPQSIKNCYASKIFPTQKPAAPTDLYAARIGTREAVLTWNFSPDLENGLPSFRIYRNQSLLKTLQGQEHNFGDAPEPPHVVLEFHDQEARDNAVYAVSAFNALGESVSQPIRLTGGN